MKLEDRMNVSVGDIVQLSPDVENPMFACNFLVVTEKKSWGVQGYIQPLGTGGEKPAGQAYYRAKWEEIEPTNGRAVWNSFNR